MRRTFPLSLGEHFIVTALVMAIFLAVIGVLSEGGPLVATWGGSGERKVELTDRDALIYQDGRWVADGRRVNLVCPTEDACAVQWQPGYVWIYRVEMR